MTLTSSVPLVEARGLGRRFEETWVLRDLDLVLAPGQILGLLGPNGAGKTTTLRILSTLDFPTEGDVFVEGRSVLVDPTHARTRIGFMPELFGLYDGLTVHEYLEVFGRIHGFEGGALERVLEDVITLTDLSGRRDAVVGGLSKGVRQRLFLAKTLIPDPAILLLDEPSSGLDPRARVDLGALLTDLKEQGKGIIISSHILSELESLVTDIAVIEAGRLVHSHRMRTDDEPHRVMEILVLDRVESALRILGGLEDVEDVAQADDRLLFSVRGDRMRVAAILADLKADGVRFYTCEEKGRSLEELYLQVTEGVVT